MEKRIHRRRKTMKHGWLVLEPGSPKIDCIVWELSSAGARIWRPYWVSLPKHFELIVPGAPAAMVQLRWQMGQEAGVQFVESAQVPSAAARSGRGDIAAA
jgi:hypothetical protein